MFLHVGYAQKCEVKCIIAFSPLHKKPFVFFLIFMGNIKVLFQLQPIIRDRAILEKKELLKKRLFLLKKHGFRIYDRKML